MAVATALAVAGVAAATAGAAISYSAAQSAAEANKNIAAGQLQQEKLRRKAMELDARRRTLEIVRQQQRARSASLSAATAQNAQLGSGLPGAYGQTAGQTGVNLLGVAQNLQLGQQMFNQNAYIAQQQFSLAAAQSFGSLGSGLTSLGGSLFTASGSPLFAGSPSVGAQYGTPTSGFIQPSSSQAIY